ncbi:hypothetical protein BDZ97DRAFT_1840786 [Flammula alnicola]|nr:hypothetical protein BDZ97DRAFT_1840786 [Flammula alnicola]
MSQHQKMQGFFPSLNSMFMDTGERYHGTAFNYCLVFCVWNFESIFSIPLVNA